MPAVYQIKFLPDGNASLFHGSRGNYYELEDGSHLDMHTTPVWCHRCGRIRHGELIETLEEIDQQLADLRNPRSKLYRALAMDFLEEYKDLGEGFSRMHSQERERRRRWREGRVSPPKCIHCGSMEILVFPIGEVVPHPAGPGTVHVSIKGMCSTSFNEWFFTPEGDRIPRDTKPTYWYHPALDNSPGSAIRWVKKLMRRNGGGHNDEGKGRE